MELGYHEATKASAHMINLAKLSKDLVTFRMAAVSVGVHLKSSLEKDRALAIFETLGGHFPELTESSVDDDATRIVLGSDQTDGPPSMVVALEELRHFEFQWGPAVTIDWSEVSERFITRLKQEFGIPPININLIDVKFVAVSSWEGNHYRAIYDAFYNNSPLTFAIEGHGKIVQNNIYLQTYLSKKHRLAIGVSSNVLEKEIVRDDFAQDLLTAHLAVGDFAIGPSENLTKAFESLTALAETVLRESFIPHVVLPLDNAVANLMKQKDKSE